jgi:hypothetical protein
MVVQMTSGTYVLLIDLATVKRACGEDLRAK